MGDAEDYVVGLRELRHQTGAILTRVRHGETIDVTQYGRLIARIVPIPERAPTPVLRQMIDEGRVRRATRPGFRPRMRPQSGTDRLGDALAALRDEESR